MAETERERRKTSLKSRMMRRGERNYSELFFESNSMKYIARGGEASKRYFFMDVKNFKLQMNETATFPIEKVF